MDVLVKTEAEPPREKVYLVEIEVDPFALKDDFDRYWVDPAQPKVVLTDQMVE